MPANFHCVQWSTCYVSIRSYFLTYPGGKNFSSLGMVAAFFSTFSELHCPTSRFLQMPLELLVMEQFSRVTGFQLHGFLLRSLSQSSTTQILQLLLSDSYICCQINATSMWLRVLPLLLGKFMPLSNTASWISVLRTIAYLDQLFQPVKTRSSFSTTILLMLSSIHP